MLFFAPELYPFTIAFIILLAIAFIEGVGLIFGMAISTVTESIFPTVDFDIDLDVSTQNGLTKLLGWMNVGRVPLLIILICFLASFGITGYLIQGAIHTLLNLFLPLFIAIPLALFGAIPFTRLFSSLMAKIMPNDESSAISIESFIGMPVSITLGKASRGSSAEAKFTDTHGQTHYIMVEPKSDDEIFEQGETVILAKKKEDNSFYAIKNNNKNLVD